MIPGEMIVEPGEIELNAGRKKLTLSVANSGDRPIQVGSHYHFYETNAALEFDRLPVRRCVLNRVSRVRWSWWPMPANAGSMVLTPR